MKKVTVEKPIAFGNIAWLLPKPTAEVLAIAPAEYNDIFARMLFAGSHMSYLSFVILLPCAWNRVLDSLGVGTHAPLDSIPALSSERGSIRFH